jgi:hypothetical protein
VRASARTSELKLRPPCEECVAEFASIHVFDVMCLGKKRIWVELLPVEYGELFCAAAPLFFGTAQQLGTYI